MASDQEGPPLSSGAASGWTGLKRTSPMPPLKRISPMPGLQRVSPGPAGLQRVSGSLPAIQAIPQAEEQGDTAFNSRES
eukprot:scaffold385004_cov35-Prasinocladus_malaysianus.AAC.1